MASACLAPDVSLGEDAPGVFREVVKTPTQLRNQVDLLFVVDNTENMAERQEELGRLFGDMLYNLALGNGLPDLHIGVVSTDMGVGPHSNAVSQCSAGGDGGMLMPPRARACADTADAFLSYGPDDRGSRIANFDGDLAGAFACMSNLGQTGCDYEQPLEAMRSSLFWAKAEGTGFVRPDSVLGIVVLTNEDDCSAFNSELFNPSAPGLSGGSPNFRCFQTGVLCDGDDVYQAGSRDGCRPQPNSDFVTSVGDYVEFLEELKPNPADRVVTAIVGDPGQVAIDRDEKNMELELMVACQDERGAAAYPGIRLDAFAEAFANTGQTTSLCDSGIAGGLRGMVRNLRKSLGTTCLEGEVLDVDLDRVGRQLDCRVFEQDVLVEQTRRMCVECDNPGNLDASSVLPCYSIQTGGEACGDFHTQLALQIHGRKELPAPGTQLIAECRVSE
ncbi:MAG: hypothetical protein GY811_08130 [Myxococcales bacterium]|nr:hypothetical protein [Myxococcales bacterium]